MNFDDILLALVSRHARSGYELKKWLDVEGIFLRASADGSQIYRTLRRLEKKGLITHETVRKSGPAAKVYAITADGAEHLRRLATTPYEPPARWQEADFTARIALLGPIRPEAIVDVIDRELALRREQARRFRARALSEEADSDLVEYDAAVLAALVDELDRQGRDATDAWIAWLEGLRERWVDVGGHRSAGDPSPSSSDASADS